MQHVRRDAQRRGFGVGLAPVVAAGRLVGVIGRRRAFESGEDLVAELAGDVEDIGERRVALDVVERHAGLVRDLGADADQRLGFALIAAHGPEFGETVQHGKQRRRVAHEAADLARPIERVAHLVGGVAARSGETQRQRQQGAQLLLQPHRVRRQLRDQ